MILVYKCKKCGEFFKLPFKENDRGELKKNSNNKLFEKCTHCNYKNKLDINMIKAISNPIISFAYGFAILISVILVLSVYFFSDLKLKNTNTNWQYYAIVVCFLIPFLFAKLLIENESKAVNMFNRYYV